jgi:pilus assembly protein CpaC
MQDEANELSVAVGKTVLVDTALPIKRVALGLGEIAEVHATSPTEVMISGKAPGETSLIIWDAKGGRQFFNVTVRQSSAISDDNLEGIRRELRPACQAYRRERHHLYARNGQESDFQ